MPVRFVLHNCDESLAHLILLQLHLETGEAEERGRAFVLSAGLEDAAHPFLRLQVFGSNPVHDDVAMSFEERHEGLNFVDHHSLLRRGEQAEDPAFVQQRPAGVATLGKLLYDTVETAGFGPR